MARWTLMMVTTALAVCALTSPAHAKWPLGISSGEIDRQFQPGVYVPYGGAGFMERVNYDAGGALFIHYDAHRLAYLNYLDALERQRCFGHTWCSRKYGAIYQIERIERDYWTKWAPCCPMCFGW